MAWFVFSVWLAWAAPMRVLVVALCACVVALLCVGCSNPNAPTSSAATWAAQHVNYVCVAYAGVPGQGVYGLGVLLPVGTSVPQGGTVVAISYCNPAE